MKIQLKTALLILITFLVIILSFSGFIYYSVTDYNHDDFFKLLEIRALTAAKLELDDVGPSGTREMSELRTKFFEKLPYEKEYFFPLTAEYNYTDEADSLKIPFSFFQSIVRNGSAELIHDNLFYKGITYKSENGYYVVIASAQNYFELYHTSYLRKILIVAIFISLVFLFFISLYISKYIFKPLTKITEKVQEISSESLHLRLDMPEKHDEMHDLIKTFNGMLSRIETAFETQNNFISNASHELRTPLTTIIGETDVVLTKERSKTEYIESLKIVLNEAEKLDNKTKALLFLAQTGFKGKKQDLCNVRIDQIVWDAKETVERINPKSKIAIDLSLLPEDPLKLKIKGNEQLLHLAFTNVISNACKYSDFQQVHVAIGASDKNVIIFIKDIGIGIPKEELKHIYDPFFRASNTNKYEGYGIGLPLTRNIIRIHQGDLIVTSEAGQGTTVKVTFPISNTKIK